MLHSAYTEQILELYRNPLNKTDLEFFDVENHQHNPLCGDDITIKVKFDAREKVENVGFQGAGCAISQAAVSLLTEKIKGLTKSEVSAIPESEMLKMLGIEISYSRKSCALLGWRSLQNALTKNYEK